MEVVGERESGRARLARPFFLVPTTSKRLLRRLGNRWGSIPERLTIRAFDRVESEYYYPVRYFSDESVVRAVKWFVVWGFYCLLFGVGCFLCV